MSTQGPSIVAIIEERLNSEDTRLPVFSPTAARIQEEIAKEEPDLASIAQIIASDQSLSSQILRTANSAFFQGLEKVTTVREAVTRIGARAVLNMVVLVTQREQYRFENALLIGVARELWQHSLACAFGARWLASRTGHGSRAEEAFLAGLLHDVGKLFLITVLEDIRRDESMIVEPTSALIEELIASMHAEQGGRLLKAWNLPEVYCRIALAHHDVEFDPTDTLMVIVRLADLACQRLGVGMTKDDSILLDATSEAQALRASDILLAELEIAIEDALGNIDLELGSRVTEAGC